MGPDISNPRSISFKLADACSLICVMFTIVFGGYSGSLVEIQANMDQEPAGNCVSLRRV